MNQVDVLGIPGGRQVQLVQRGATAKGEGVVQLRVRENLDERTAMTLYRGYRDDDFQPHVIVEQQGNCSPLPYFVRHSPSGIEWGYAGSGPADLARSILAHHLAARAVPHVSVYQAFKFRVIADLPKQHWILTSEQIDAGLNDILTGA